MRARPPRGGAGRRQDAVHELREELQDGEDAGPAGFACES
jgi:hypothetical protein